jgi:hypothetical protein
MILLFANNAVSTIASPITAASTSVQLQTGDGAKFPNPVVGSEFFKLTFVDAATGFTNEIVNCTARNGDVLTIVRAQEGTLARAWGAGDSAKNMTTAQTQGNFIQVQQAQTGGTNTAVDTGTLNSYAVALIPAVTTRIFGLYVRIKAAPGNTNSGPSTLNLGAGSFPIINPDGTQLGANAIIGGGIFEIVDDGVMGYQLISASQQLQSSQGVATTGDVKWRPTNDVIAGWVTANTQTIGNALSNAAQLASPTAANLFAWLWNNFSNTQCPVFTSAGAATTRGTNAAADFAANKQIATLDLRGMSIIAQDYATGRLTGVPVISGSANSPGSILGESIHTLTAAELAAHTHSGTTGSENAGHSHTGSGTTGGDSPDHSHGYTSPSPGPGTGTSPNYFDSSYTSANTGGASARHAHSYSFSTSGESAAHQHAFTTDGGTGGGGAHNNTQLSMTGTWYLKQ